MLADATLKVRERVTIEGRTVARMLDREQRAAHGLSWLATYVESVRQLTSYAERMAAAGTLGETEELIVRIGIGEYLSQIAGGIPISQNEIVRPSDFGLSMMQVASRLGTPQVEALIAKHHVVWLGGDHSVTLPLLRAQRARLGRPLAIVHFDAHCDTWEYDESHPLHHGMMFLKAARDGLVDPARSVQIGMRTPNDTMGFNVFDMNAVLEHGVKGLVAAIHELTAGLPIYLTIDIDSLDPAFAPGTGTPEPGGLTSADLMRMVRHLATHHRVVAMDVVEVAPAYDHADCTVNVANRLFMECLAGMAARRRAEQGGTPGRPGRAPL